MRVTPGHADGSSAPPQPNTCTATRIWGPAPAGNVLTQTKSTTKATARSRHSLSLQNSKCSLENVQLCLVCCPSTAEDLRSCLLARSGQILVPASAPALPHIQHRYPGGLIIPEAPRSCWRIYFPAPRTRCPCRVGAAGELLADPNPSSLLKFPPSNVVPPKAPRLQGRKKFQELFGDASMDSPGTVSSRCLLCSKGSLQTPTPERQTQIHELVGRNGNLMPF